MNDLICLTDWESGNEVWVDPDAVTLCQRLEAEVCDIFEDEPTEIGERTKLIVPPHQILLVRETPAEIRALALQRA